MVVGVAVVVVVVVVAAVVVVVVVAVAVAVVVVVDADATCQAVELRPSVAKRIASQSTKSSTQIELVLWSYACHEFIDLDLRRDPCEHPRTRRPDGSSTREHHN